ncbi:hypothetical protein GCM10017566_40500 [Amycolatopsis bartoniae]|uniref:RNA polymerase sigma factor n=1 Tax=Amycolatopsis bartoniae TaxID=941986 RepID=A0A8H9IZR5_9PSEU|nr:hypothetical protein GCM10017566_40500 [Amycolatopsis bartoniae]
MTADLRLTDADRSETSPNGDLGVPTDGSAPPRRGNPCEDAPQDGEPAGSPLSTAGSADARRAPHPTDNEHDISVAGPPHALNATETVLPDGSGSGSGTAIEDSAGGATVAGSVDGRAPADSASGGRDAAADSLARAADARDGAAPAGTALAPGGAGGQPSRTGGGGDGSTNEVDAAINALWREFRERPNQRLRERLVLHYAPLVKYVAGRVGTGLPTHVDVGDLVQSGIFGLIDAIEKFDPDRGWRFETYAMQRIRGAILDDLRSQDWVPRVVRSRLREAERALERLGARLHRTPSDTELAEELGIGLDELRDLYGQLRLTSVVALEDLIAAGKDSGSLVDTLQDEDAVDPVAVLVDRDNRRQLAEAIAQLTERDRIVVSLYYFESLTLAEIGKVLGVTESRVSQLHTRAVLRLRARLTEQASV